MSYLLYEAEVPGDKGNKWLPLMVDETADPAKASCSYLINDIKPTNWAGDFNVSFFNQKDGNLITLAEGLVTFSYQPHPTIPQFYRVKYKDETSGGGGTSTVTTVSLIHLIRQSDTTSNTVTEFPALPLMSAGDDVDWTDFDFLYISGRNGTNIPTRSIAVSDLQVAGAADQFRLGGQAHFTFNPNTRVIAGVGGQGTFLNGNVLLSAYLYNTRGESTVSGGGGTTTVTPSYQFPVNQFGAVIGSGIEAIPSINVPIFAAKVDITGIETPSDWTHDSSAMATENEQRIAYLKAARMRFNVRRYIA